jgi:hypothetical protein
MAYRGSCHFTGIDANSIRVWVCVVTGAYF